MNKELNEDARTKQDLLYECSNLESKLSDEIVKNERLEQQYKKQKEVIDNAIEYIETNTCWELRTSKVLDILKEVSE